MQRLGRHFIVELFDCTAEFLNDLEVAQTLLLAIARRTQATMVGSMFHQLSPLGLSGVVVTSESRLSVHTWPAHRYAAVDIFARGEALTPDVAIESMIAAFAAGHVSILEIHRGILPTTLAPRPVAALQSARVEDGRIPHQPKTHRRATPPAQVAR